MRSLIVAVALTLAAACSGPTDNVLKDVVPAPDGTALEETMGDVVADLPMEETRGDVLAADEFVFDFLAQDEKEAPECEVGEGCFLDPCKSNDDCLSGWCVGHMGEDVCTQQCQSECPPGWRCEQVPGTIPDVVWICVSSHANLCLPCATGADCKGAAGVDDVCVDYGQEGSFCGGSCVADDDCPWGFSCADAQTVAGVSTKQCVADAGVCPCTSKSVELALYAPCEVSNEFGTCSGKRICTDAGLTDCDAAQAEAEICDGLDNDCDGDVDEPNEVGGNYINLCDDGNACTTDSCDGETGCAHVELSEGECVDGDACTVGDHCDAGLCVGLPIVCDDDNPCTDDLCDGLGGCKAEFNAATCDDGDPCTVADTCAAGECVGYAVDCKCESDGDCAQFDDGNLCNGTLICDTGSLPYQCVVDPDTVVVCPIADDQSICEQTVCNPESGVCEVVPAHTGYACSDDNVCTIGDVCDDGACVAGNAAMACDDSNVCTDDTCDPEVGCLHAPNAADCDDANACSTGDHCAAGKCVAAVTLDCDDDNPCTMDGCSPVDGCTHTITAGACDDGDPCTVNDMCINGLCASGEELACDDANPCTADSCVAPGKCVHEPFAGECTDNNVCTKDDQCLGGTCVAGVPVDCDDGNVCTVDSCSPVDGCQYSNAEGACDDKDPCTINDVCTAGLCVSGDPIDCDDDNPCTVDSCSPAGKCVHAPFAGECSDGNPCTVNDHCDQGKCVANQAQKCDDDNVCTTDSCDPVQGCVHLLNSAPCDDGDVCTTGDYCHLGECTTKGVLNCNDNNPCTDDACQGDVGCVFTPNAAPCDDGSVCTQGDACVAGSCKGGAVLSCDDDNVCTDDLCDFATGCKHFNNSVICNDANACTANEFCADGICGGGVPVVCDDEKLCTDDSCDPDSGCLFTNNTLACDDDNACTDGDVCGDGACVPGPALDCEDNNVCTDDSCSEATGCVHAPVDDETTCGADVHCIAGECVPICDPPAGSKTFSVTKSIESWVVPECIESVTIEAWGAQGGKNVPCPEQGGKGAYMKGTFAVTPGETLKIVVGERGLDRGSDMANQSGTGGGGSFIWRDQASALLLAAGGGGGGAICTSGGGHDHATGVGGTTGACGTADSINANTGGCDGADGNGGNCRGKGWTAVKANPAGYSYEAQGGYGGGGSVGNSHGGGGGGGYGGGGCKPYTGHPAAAGGGGGSYNIGSDTSSQSGVKTGHGSVVFTW